MRTRHKIISVGLVLVLLACAAGGLVPRFTNVAQAAPSGKQKVGDDLKKKDQNASSDDDVNVIIQPNGAWTPALDADLSSRGATKKSSLKNFAFRAVRMKAKDVDAIAARSDVAYISLDSELESFGHVSLTTGADAARALGGGANGYTGSGVGIAIFDSGL